ncbi:MAG TPA: hypothetical protein VJG30_00470 [Candidatus Nanoarchaeia archaeon]|nr:hypothetical protein [Candidatus Nanoarchaeia archaeon]
MNKLQGCAAIRNRNDSRPNLNLNRVPGLASERLGIGQADWAIIICKLIIIFLIRYVLTKIF